MDRKPRRVDLDDFGDDAMNELSDDDICKVTGGSWVAGDGFAAGTPGPSLVQVRGWVLKEKKAFIGKADE